MFWWSLLVCAFCFGSFTKGQCPPNWSANGERCFYASASSGSWAEGMKLCKQMGGELASIESPSTQTFLASMIQSNSHKSNVTLHTANDYSYHYLHDLGVDVTAATSTTFRVQACNDAHIALSETKGLDTSNTYEIVIGGWSDSESVIRDCKQCQHKDEVRHNSHPLDCKQAHPFWISWANNYIRVGKGNIVGEQQFMSWNDTDPHQVNYVAVSTGFGATGDWTFDKNTYMPGKFWVGSTDLVTEGEWLWLPSEVTTDEYSNWVPGQPDNLNGYQHCMVIDSNSAMQWRDDNCEEGRNFICQKSIGNDPGIIG